MSIPRNSVGTRQLKDGAVTTPKLHLKDVTSKKTRNHSLTLKDLGGKDQKTFTTVITGSDIQLSDGQCLGTRTGNIGSKFIGDMVVGTVTDANGHAAISNGFTMIPTIVIGTNQGGAEANFLVCDGSGGSDTLPAGSVFHWRLIDAG